MSQHFPPPPIFGVHGQEETVAKNGIISLVDIFDEFLFAGERSALPSTDQAGNLIFTPVEDEDEEDDDDISGDNYDSDEGRKRKKPRGTQRSMTEEQKIERRYDFFDFSTAYLITAVGSVIENTQNDRE
jgi:hypothetical protein